MSTQMEPFSIIEKLEQPTPSSSDSGPHHLFNDVLNLTSAKTADHDLQYIAALREANPGMIVTAIPASNVNLRIFAAAGYARCEVDLETDSYASWRGYAPPRTRSGTGALAEAVSFGKYRYSWGDEDFILYTINSTNQYVLKECRSDEHPLGPSSITDQLIKAVGDWMTSILDVVWVYDGYWRQSRELYDGVMKASWEDVILDEEMKADLTKVARKFFSSKAVYEDLGVPWKRGLMFYGPPGNGKTISIRALMHELYTRKDKDGNLKPIPTLYVKSAPTTWDIGDVFARARAEAPCMLILEDVETIVTPDTRSYFFNEMDGLANNDGLFVVASTNYLDKLDPGLTKRPSRFDRKYKFPLPNEHERTLYCDFWRKKLKSNKSIDFPKKLLVPMARATPGFSFAFLQECFVATLLELAREGDDVAKARPYDDSNDGLDDYRLWVVFKKEAEVLRKQIDSQQRNVGQSQLAAWCKPGDGMIGNEPVVASSAGPTRGKEGHCNCCRCREREQKPFVLAHRGPKARGELLPELPWYYQKEEYINSAAFEMR
ncbi:uncharacterized protein LTR77_010129 [Saxophila tyrrhenica]|uniref:AAA+ ATPase domain-containing protein n=1 Tax=Saxophila tyrrhenica TaxID=1690608 RepID=A0AAV9NZY4_9PEZI|nr:hypothetical protein LTR77_010129 [Saxophila tyrrhenica]